MSHKTDFIDFALQYDALQFGEFTLKSGRVSPYFYNARRFADGQGLKQIGAYYAQAILDANIEFDMLFGPAYAGIPLVCAVATALAEKGRNVPFAFDRKEPKKHGEGGMLVGAPVQGKVLVIDDVVSAGTAFRVVKPLIEEAGGEVAGLAIQVDRQEKGTTELSAVQQIQQEHAIPVISIVNLDDLIAYLSEKGDTQPALLTAIEAYRQQYGA